MRVMSLILRGAPLVLVLGGGVDGPQLRPGVDFDTDGDFDEDIGRARVLHVFIDRGDSEVVDDTPMDTEDLPVPSPVLVS